MSNIDLQYQNLLQDILDNGTQKTDRTGTGTLSVFGRQIRHKMSEGFPLLTTKKIAWKSVVTELLWFLRGDTNIKYLVDNGCHIWDGDAYKAYVKRYNKGEYVGKTKLLENSKKNRTLTEPFTQEEFINKIKTDNKFAKQWGNLGKIYGFQWRNWNGEIDQISDLIKQLKENPDSRRLIVNAWNASDLPHQVLPPCHYGFQVYTRELSLEERMNLIQGDEHDKIIVAYCENPSDTWLEGQVDVILNQQNIPTRAISLMWNQRSVDTPLGLPFNIASYGLLLEIIAKVVNMIPDELIGNLGDTHIYLNQIEGVKEQITREPFPLPKLNINTEWWPTEGGECGIGNISVEGFIKGLNDDNFIKCLLEEDIQLSNYQSNPVIKFPLSN